MQPDHADAVSTRRPRPHRRWLLSAALATALLAAGCATAQFNVTKNVTGGSSTGPFTVNISCTQPIGPPLDKDIIFNGPGTDNTTTFQFVIFGDCTITEPVTAGATSVTISCTDPVPAEVECGTPGPSLTMELDGEGAEDQLPVNISVVNDFPAPTTTTTIDPNASVNAGAVSAAPDFTG